MEGGKGRISRLAVYDSMPNNQLQFPITNLTNSISIHPIRVIETRLGETQLTLISSNMILDFDRFCSRDSLCNYLTLGYLVKSFLGLGVRVLSYKLDEGQRVGAIVDKDPFFFFF